MNVNYKDMCKRLGLKINDDNVSIDDVSKLIIKMLFKLSIYELINEKDNNPYIKDVLEIKLQEYYLNTLSDRELLIKNITGIGMDYDDLLEFYNNESKIRLRKASAIVRSGTIVKYGPFPWDIRSEVK